MTIYSTYTYTLPHLRSRLTLLYNARTVVLKPKIKPCSRLLSNNIHCGIHCFISSHAAYCTLLKSSSEKAQFFLKSSVDTFRCTVLMFKYWNDCRSRWNCNLFSTCCVVQCKYLLLQSPRKSLHCLTFLFFHTRFKNQIQSMTTTGYMTLHSILVS